MTGRGNNGQMSGEGEQRQEQKRVEKEGACEGMTAADFLLFVLGAGRAPNCVLLKNLLVIGAGWNASDNLIFTLTIVKERER